MRLPDIFLLCVISVVSVLPLGFLNCEPENSQLFLGKYKTPKKTLAPINVNSKNVKVENTSTPLYLHATLSDKVIVVNTGKIVEVILAQHETTSYVTGGILKEDKYIFRGIKYLWTLNTSDIAASTIDNKGYPLENVAIFYNQKYTTFENALNYRDGLVLLDYFIDVCSSPNKKFDKYYVELKRIQEPGSVVFTTLGTSINWFAGNGVIPPEKAYYAYPGSYIDEKTGKRYFCSTVILLNHLSQWCLSKKQYEETFGSFRGLWKSKLYNKKCQFPQKMPVVEAKGIRSSNVQ